MNNKQIDLKPTEYKAKDDQKKDWSKATPFEEWVQIIGTGVAFYIAGKYGSDVGAILFPFLPNHW